MLEEELPVKVVLKSCFSRKLGQLHCFLSGPPSVFCLYVFPLSVFIFWRITTEMYCILGANELRRIFTNHKCTPMYECWRDQDKNAEQLVKKYEVL